MEHLWPALIGVAVGSRAPWLLAHLARILGLTDARQESELVRQVQRVGDLEDMIAVLRNALDRHLIRESAIASACELLIMLAGLIDHPSEAMLRIRDRAQQLLEDARRQTLNMHGRGDQ